LLLAGIARQTSHAEQSRMLVTLTHACADQVKAMIANVRKSLDFVLASAPQLPKSERWQLLVRYIIARILPGSSRRQTPGSARPPPIPALGSG
jgi:hypothetical protein